LDLSLLTALVVVLRAYGLGDQSVWMDEHLSMRYIGSPALGAFLLEQRGENWEMTPAYYTLQFLWAQVFGTTPAAVRSLSVLLSALAGMALYGIARNLFGRGIAVLTVVLFAMSPHQVFHGQALRPYALAVLLGLLALAGMLAVYRGRRGAGILLSGAATALLIWSHVLGALLLLPQAIALASARPQLPLKWLVLWTFAQLAAFASAAAWIVSNKIVPPPSADATGLLAMVGGLFSTESTPVDWTVGAPGELDTSGLSALLRALVLIHPAARAVLSVLLLAGFAVGGYRLWSEPANRREGVLLLSWVLLPPVALLLFSWIWSDSAYQHRYLIYIYPVLGMVAAFGLTQFGTRTRRGLAAALLASMLALTTLALALPMRPDYLGAARAIAAQGGPGTVVYTLGLKDYRLFDYNGRIVGVVSEWLAYDGDFVDCLAAHAEAGDAAWAACSSDFFGADFLELEALLLSAVSGRGGRLEWVAFPGMQTIHLFRYVPNESITDAP
jgi:uncharacterized membrane protein